MVSVVASSVSFSASPASSLVPPAVTAQEVNRVGAGGVELAVADTAAGAHALDVARSNDRAVTDRVAVREFAGEHVADDFHLAVAVSAEARTRLDPILVYHAQRPELHVLRIEVICKCEGMAGLEPAVICVAALCAAPDFLHGLWPPG